MSRDEGFLSRWSRRKHDAAAGRPVEEPPAGAHAPEPPAATAAAPSVPVSPTAPAAPPELPPVESLTFESDFAPFMAKDVDPALRRAALKTLLNDERFNVMDGLDVYIDDYTKPSPIPPEWYAKMTQMASLGDAAARVEDTDAPADTAQAGDTAQAEDTVQAQQPPQAPRQELAHPDAQGCVMPEEAAHAASRVRDVPGDLSEDDISRPAAASPPDAPQQ